MHAFLFIAGAAKTRHAHCARHADDYKRTAHLAFVLHDVLVDLPETRRQSHTDHHHEYVHVRPHESCNKIQKFADKRFPWCVRGVREHGRQLG